MAAVIGLEDSIITECLANEGLRGVDLANFNSPGQIVVSGPAEEIQASFFHLKMPEPNWWFL